MLGAPGDVGVDAELGQLLGHDLAGLGDVALALAALLGHQALDLVVLAGVQRLEGEVLQLPLDGVDTEPMGDRGVDVERLARLLQLLLLGHGRDRAHVVQAVGELDEDDPDVGGHRHHHLAVVLGLGLVAGLEGQVVELGDPVHEARDLLAEGLAHLLQRGTGVLDGVVQQGRAQRLGVQAHAGADLGHADGMDDELLPGEPALVGVVEAGVGERCLHAVAIHGQRLTGVLLHDREQVAQQPLLKGRKLGVLHRLVAARTGDPVDARAVGGQHRRGGVAAGLVATRLAAGARVTATDGSAQAPARSFALFRYRCPSSYTSE